MNVFLPVFVSVLEMLSFTYSSHVTRMERYQGFTHNMDNPKEVRENLLLDSMRINHRNKTENYHFMLQKKESHKKQAFESMKQELYQARRQINTSRNNLQHKNDSIDEDNAIYKRDTGDNGSYSTTIRSTVLKKKPIISQEKILSATTPILDNYLYIDKTRFVDMLLEDNPSRYFFARPRRFGKTILLRTIEAALDHKRKGEIILKGTHISNSGHDWEKEKYQILYFDLSQGSLPTVVSSTLGHFKINEKIDIIPKRCVYRQDMNHTTPLTIQHFYEILCVATTESIVILVDEYDFHILEHSNNPEMLKDVIHYLRCFFLMMKSWAVKIRLAFITGLTQSSHMLFNTPGGDFNDISIDSTYAEMVGITKNELQEYFKDSIQMMAIERKMSTKEIEQELEDWYDGYSFTPALEKLYNPMSVIRYFREKKPGSYWSNDGRSSFVWEQMKRRIEDFRSVYSGMTSNLRRFPNLNYALPETLLFESGYYTIKEVLKDGRYKVGFPNKEVRETFSADQINAAKFGETDSIDREIVTMKKKIHQRIPDFNTFMAAADTAIMKLPHPHDDEKGYHMNLYYLLRECNIHIAMEQSMRNARADLTGETPYTLIYLELKLKHEGMKVTWDQTLRSIRHLLYKEKNVLGAAILFEGEKDKDCVVYAWHAVLFSPDGNVLQEYDANDVDWFKTFSVTPKITTKKLSNFPTTKMSSKTSTKSTTATLDY